MKRSQKMRILLDENFPVDFVKLLVGHEIITIHIVLKVASRVALGQVGKV